MTSCPKYIYMDGVRLLPSDWHWSGEKLTLSFGAGPTDHLIVCDLADKIIEYEIAIDHLDNLCVVEVSEL